MNVEDRTRFARYYPGYIEPPEADTSDNEKNQENEDEKKTKETTDKKTTDKKTTDKETTDKKNILGYIDKISIDKDKLVMDTIVNSNANSNPRNNQY